MPFSATAVEGPTSSASTPANRQDGYDSSGNDSLQMYQSVSEMSDHEDEDTGAMHNPQNASAAGSGGQQAADAMPGLVPALVPGFDPPQPAHAVDQQQPPLRPAHAEPAVPAMPPVPEEHAMPAAPADPAAPAVAAHPVGDEPMAFEDLIGLRGPVRLLFENAGTMILSTAMFMVGALWLPFTWGRLTIKSIAMVQAAWKLTVLPVTAVQLLLKHQQVAHQCAYATEESNPAQSVLCLAHECSHCVLNAGTQDTSVLHCSGCVIRICISPGVFRL